jgi:hypothetical protein
MRLEMAKRFYDTNIFSSPWFSELSPKMKCLWWWMLCECSHAGILEKPNFRLASFQIGETTSLEEFRNVFESKIVEVKKDVFFIPNFLKRQYPTGLNSKKPVIVSVLKELKAHRLILTTKQILGEDFINHSIMGSESLGNDCIIIKDKDKDKVKDKDKDNNKIEKNSKFFSPDEIVDLYNKVIAPLEGASKASAMTGRSRNKLFKGDEKNNPPLMKRLKVREDWVQYFNAVIESKQLHGNEKGRWRDFSLSLTFLCDYDTFLRVSDGEYKIKESSELNEDQKAALAKSVEVGF